MNSQKYFGNGLLEEVQLSSVRAMRCISWNLVNYCTTVRKSHWKWLAI